MDDLDLFDPFACSCHRCLLIAAPVFQPLPCASHYFSERGRDSARHQWSNQPGSGTMLVYGLWSTCVHLTPLRPRVLFLEYKTILRGMLSPSQAVPFLTGWNAAVGRACWFAPRHRSN